MFGKKFAVVVGQQRSGTTVFNWCLERDPKIQPFGEVFHDQTIDRDGNYFKFLSEFDCQPGVKYLPSKDNRRILFNEYIAHLSRITSREICLIDVKYNSWHHLNTYWKNFEDRPDLMDFIEENNFTIIHIFRENVFEQALSMHFASQTGIYHVRDGDQEVTSTKKIKVNCRWMLGEMNRSVANTNRFRRFMKTNNNIMELEYTSLIKDDHISPVIAENLKQQLNLSGSPLGPTPLKKVTPPASAVIENIEEVQKFFSETRHADLVDAALSK